MRLAVLRHPLRHPGFDVVRLFGIQPTLRAMAHDLFEGAAGLHQRRGVRVHVAVALVAHHEPVIGVVQHKGVVQRVHGTAQQVGIALGVSLGLAARGDVGVGGDEATAGHRRAAHFQRRAVGAHALKTLRHRGALQAGHHLAHGAVGIARAVFAAFGVEAHDVFEAQARPLHQRGGQVQQPVQLGVGQHAVHVAVEHTQAAGQAVDDGVEQFVLVAQPFFQRPPCGDFLEGAHQPHRLASNQLPLAHRAHPDAPPSCRDHRHFNVEAAARVQAVLHRVDDGLLRRRFIEVERCRHGGAVARCHVVHVAGLVGPGKGL